MGKTEHRLPDPRSEELCALVAEQLVRRRKDAGWNQEELAARLGLSRQSVSKWECGDCLPDTVNLLALADLYGTSVDELLGREDTAVEGAHDEETGAGALALCPPATTPPASTNAIAAAGVFRATPAGSPPKTEAGSREASNASGRAKTQEGATGATLTAAAAARPLSARLPRPLLFSAAWLAVVMIAAVGMSMGYAAYTWLPVIPLYCWMLTTLEKDAANGSANSRPGSTATSFLTASVGTQARIALVALATLVLCGAAFIFMIGWTAGCGPWGLPWVPSGYAS